MPSNVVDLVAPMHVVRVRYFVKPAGLARPKRLDLQKKNLDKVIIKY
jgi:hypothetical protein